MKRSLEGFQQYLIQGMAGFNQQAARLGSVSKRTLVLLIIVEVFLGAVVIAQLAFLGNLIDALYAAKALGVVTSEVTKYVWYEVALFIALLPALMVHHQFQGLAKRLGTTVRSTALIVAAFLATLPIAPINIFLLLVLAPVVDYINDRRLTGAYAAVVLLFACWRFSTVIIAVVQSDATLGNVLYWGGSLLALAGFLALRPYIVQAKQNT